jgi:hypothetical protein
MRKAVLVVLALVAATGCDPLIQKFEVVPQQVNCSAPVTITYQGQGDGLHLKADQPVAPAIPDTGLILPKAGTQIETVSQTTEFSLYYPGAGHREKTVTVTHNNCGGGPGPGTCGPSQMTFNGTCFNAQSGPQYDMHSLSVAVAPGALVNITSNADFPVHVQHAGADIALGAGGGPLPPGIPPGTPAAGSYTIYVPGQVGMLVCQGAGPTQGSFPAPPVTLTITPTCPMP